MKLRHIRSRRREQFARRSAADPRETYPLDGSNGYMTVGDPRAQSDGSKREQVRQCMDLEHCPYTAIDYVYSVSTLL
jgi:hypothetical protein